MSASLQVPAESGLALLSAVSHEMEMSESFPHSPAVHAQAMEGIAETIAIGESASESARVSPPPAPTDADLMMICQHALWPIVDRLKQHCFRDELFIPSVCKDLLTALTATEDIMTKRSSKQSDTNAGLKLVDEPLSIHMFYEVTERCFGKSIKKMTITDEVRLLFESGFILLISRFIRTTPAGQTLCMDITELLHKYPEFVDPAIESVELVALLKFRNMMALCLCVIQANAHKNHLLDLCTRLAEGKYAQKYAVGSGQSDRTSRRVLIYRREGNVPLVCRGPRSGSFSSSAMTACGSESLVKDSDDGDDEAVLFAAGSPSPEPAGEATSSFSCNNSSTAFCGWDVLGLNFGGIAGAGIAGSSCIDSLRHPAQTATTVHKLESRRQRHLTYLDSSIVRRHDAMAQKRDASPANVAPQPAVAPLVQSFELSILNADGSITKQTVHNVISLHPA